ncbi:kinase-like protein [Artomyces pyxidatus]|uniref:Kinase-like protein n=1 Tax=Artomyces pyxidatus TaxID=48021 RepID=A0ACB8TGU1_9AGAM|nr:kinase-like protein [Artomyces pyxidatus]
MLAAPAVDITFDDDDWVARSDRINLPHTASVGNSWGVTSIGRGFQWGGAAAEEEDDELSFVGDAGDRRTIPQVFTGDFFSRPLSPVFSPMRGPSSAVFTSPGGPIFPITTVTPSTPLPGPPDSPKYTTEPFSYSPTQSPVSSRPLSPISPSVVLTPSGSPRLDRSPTSPRPRRRSSQQRVSLIAGRLSIAPIEPPSPPPVAPQKLIRSGSSVSLLSAAPSTRPPTPAAVQPANASERSISEFVIQGDLGKGAYGLVKKAREMREDGTLGPPLVIKQVIKSRILADCWKRHPKYGTIPIEIYVMSSISNTSYILPPRRPWDPMRFSGSPFAPQFDPDPDFEWIEGATTKGHPNICPLLDFFEDNHYYYLVLPSTVPQPKPSEPTPPSDLFDLVESYPEGLPASMVRTYLGQIADAMSFLHARGIVHRDIKDENVVLGPNGRCIVIDFGSSGLVRKGGWDTFSGTLDYAGPEILRGERYQGKEQDVWAFGVVAYVMLVGECPFTTAAEAQEGLVSPFSSASIALDERCTEGKERDGEEADGGGALGDAAALVRACLQLEVASRPSFDKILESRFLAGKGGWGLESL